MPVPIRTTKTVADLRVLATTQGLKVDRPDGTGLDGMDRLAEAFEGLSKTAVALLAENQHRKQELDKVISGLEAGFGNLEKLASSGSEATQVMMGSLVERETHMEQVLTRLSEPHVVPNHWAFVVRRNDMGLISEIVATPSFTGKI